MRWGDFRRSDNVEDRGDSGDSGGGGFPLGGGMRLGGGAIIVVVVASLLLGINPLEMLGMLSGEGPPPQVQREPAPQGGSAPPANVAPQASARDETKEMVAHVLGDTEDVWSAIFKASGSRYDPPKLVLFRGATRSACGRAVTAVGPFYCSADREVY